MMKKIILLGTILTALFLFFACEEKECTEPVRNDAGFGFYTYSNGEETDTSLALLSIHGAARPDSLLYDSARNSSKVFLQLDPTRDFSNFIFVTDSLADTLQIGYQRELNLISQACGFIMDFHVQHANTSHHHFDSVVVVNHTITQNNNEEHFKIYLSPADTTGL